MEVLINKLIGDKKTKHPSKTGFRRPDGYWSLYHEDGGTMQCVIRDHRPNILMRICMKHLFGHVWIDY
jgi:hypothetical protein